MGAAELLAILEDCVREMIHGAVERYRELAPQAFVSARQENLATIHSTTSSPSASG